ncbi:filamentous hemagglutinin N-terminal domain-containing protein [Alkalinema sp. FACHB-956]|uniref:two-partner secretion domain-containing protein n=1 Tax=Alkalinema sp. FACHB-956 TaxID=2692768 RepID=UPI0016876854|nr:filamentous hemagglutinin N-terminal domain-containing protein [Alkalinema sp. FACHB-956]MBD2328073.1 filamentous hemagglutinin N-terminal domain-containing protein [Alkalinema sp. FACHB-956]
MNVRLIVSVLGGGVGLLSSVEFAQAQVIPDGTLSTTATSPNALDFTIDNGARSGGNLFHSFSQFSVPTGGSAFFNNALDVQNIFARVTGSTASNINGLIKANGSASLFLLNPSGILFGPNASLNLGGSFIGTTANSVKFGDGTEFSAVNPSNPPVLTMSAPIGLQMGETSGSITVQGTGHQLTTTSTISPYFASAPYSGLNIAANQTLALIGGDIDLKGGVLQAPGGRIELNSVAQPGLIQLQPVDQGFSTQTVGITKFGSINLTQQSSIEVGDIIPGNVQIQGGQINIQQGSLIHSKNLGISGAGAIAVSAANRLVIQDTVPNSNALGGILQDNFGPVGGGQIIIQTPELLTLSGGVVYSRNYGSGLGTTIAINTDKLTVFGYDVNSPENFSRIGTLATAGGKGGQVLITSKSLAVKEGGFIGSANFLQGSGSGDVFINADTIDIQGLSSLKAPSIIGSYNLAKAEQSGTVVINSRILQVSNGGQVGTSTISAGDAGNLIINASESVSVNGYSESDFYTSSIASAVVPPLPLYQKLFGLPAVPSGAGGDIIINTPFLALYNGGSVTIENFGSNRAGKIDINAGEIKLDDYSYIGAFNLVGNGGDIQINSNLLVLNHRSIIGTTSFGTDNGSGGNIIINSPIILGLNNSDILADAIKGNGGQIQITTKGLFGLQYRAQRTPENDINASSQFGINGTVQINGIEVVPSSNLGQLPTTLSDASQQIVKGCGTTSDSSFVVSGKGGLPQNPNQDISVFLLWSDLRDLFTYRSSQSSVAASPADPSALVQASGFKRKHDGSIELVASPVPVNTPAIANCSGPSITTAYGMH